MLDRQGIIQSKIYIGKHSPLSHGDHINGHPSYKHYGRCDGCYRENFAFLASQDLLPYHSCGREHQQSIYGHYAKTIDTIEFEQNLYGRPHIVAPKKLISKNSKSIEMLIEICYNEQDESRNLQEIVKW